MERPSRSPAARPYQIGCDPLPAPLKMLQKTLGMYSTSSCNTLTNRVASLGSPTSRATFTTTVSLRPYRIECDLRQLPSEILKITLGKCFFSLFSIPTICFSKLGQPDPRNDRHNDRLPPSMPNRVQPPTDTFGNAFKDIS